MTNYGLRINFDIRDLTLILEILSLKKNNLMTDYIFFPNGLNTLVYPSGKKIIQSHYKGYSLDF